MNVISRVLVDVRLLHHLVCQVYELLSIQLHTNFIILSHVVEQGEDLLSAGVGSGLILLFKLALHEQVQNLGLVSHELLVGGVLGDGVQKCNNAFVKLNLMVVGEVDNHRVVDCFGALKLTMCGQLFNIHHVSEAEKSINVNTRLQIL